MKSLLLALLLSLGICTSLQAQQIPTMNLAGLKAHMLAKGDTLTIYNFWATWCRPCIAEIPYFEQLNREYADRGVKVVFVSVDFPDQYDRMVALTQKKNMQAERIHLDEPNQNTLINGVSPNWTGTIPASLAVGPGVYTFREQSFTYEELTEWVDGILADLEDE